MCGRHRENGEHDDWWFLRAPDPISNGRSHLCELGHLKQIGHPNLKVRNQTSPLLSINYPHFSSSTRGYPFVALTAPNRELIPLLASHAIVMAPHAATLKAAAVPIVAASERRFAPLRTVCRRRAGARGARRRDGRWKERGRERGKQARRRRASRLSSLPSFKPSHCLPHNADAD